MNFIDGVILVEEMKSLPDEWFIKGIIVLIAVLMVLITGLKITLNEKASVISIVGSLICILVGTVGTVIGLGIFSRVDYFNIQEPNGKYRVVVTNEVDMDEFQRTYDIVDYKDGVYTIKNKDADVN